MQKDLFIKIVKDYLRKEIHGPILLALSGGADSWFLYFLLKEIDIPFTPLTLCFEKQDYGESEKVMEYFNEIDEEPQFEWVSNQEMINEFHDFSKEIKVVIYNLHPVSKWIFAKKASEKGYCQVISGDGADQWFQKVENCDLFPIVKQCFQHFNLRLTTPLATDQTWGVVNAKDFIYDYVSENLKAFKRQKIVKLYPDDDFLPLTCLEQSKHLVEV